MSQTDCWYEDPRASLPKPTPCDCQPCTQARRARRTPEETPDPRRIRRVLHEGDPRGDDYREAQEWVRDVRSRLVHLRGELEDVGRIEAVFPRDRLCSKVAGSLTLAIIALHGLLEGERSFAARAERLDALWKEVAADPDGFVIEPGGEWDWRPHGIFVRGGLPT